MTLENSLSSWNAGGLVGSVSDRMRTKDVFKGVSKISISKHSMIFKECRRSEFLISTCKFNFLAGYEQQDQVGSLVISKKKYNIAVVVSQIGYGTEKFITLEIFNTDCKYLEEAKTLSLNCPWCHFHTACFISKFPNFT